MFKMRFTTLCICALLGFVVFASTTSGDENVYVRAPVGEIVGHYKNLTWSGQQYWYSSFLSIPFAETTAGENRFRKPLKKAAFETPYVASELKPACYQKSSPFGKPLPMSEDCLHLSIMVPGNVSDAKSLAVMIYIHGGGLQQGSHIAYTSPSLAALNDVIAVFINYRVSALGFLTNRKNLPGNYGFWDQHMAIHWVRDNIEAFGGDSDRITLFGMSAGAVSVMYQGLYKGNQKLVTGLITQSAPWMTLIDRNPIAKYDALVDKAGCKNTNEEIQNEEFEIECLRKLSPEVLYNYVTAFEFYQPIVDGEFVTISPDTVFDDNSPEAMSIKEYFGDLNVILGVSKYDGVILGMLPNFGIGYQGITVEEFEAAFVRNRASLMTTATSKLITTAVVNDYINWTNPENKIMNGIHYYDVERDWLYVVPMVRTARAHARTNGKGDVYAYEFLHKPSYAMSPSWLDGAVHADDTMFPLGFPEMNVASLPANEVDLSMKMMRYWTQFAKTGNPNNPVAISQWPEYTQSDQKYIIFDTSMTSFPVKERMRAKYIHLWDVVVPEILALDADSTGCKHHVTNASGSPRHYQNGVIMLVALVLACLVI